MGFQKEIGRSEVVLSVFSKFSYNESVYSLLRTLPDKKICYVTLNKPASALQWAFKLNKIDTGKIFFIDAVSKQLGKASSNHNTVLVSSPTALTEISIALQEAMKSRAFDVVFFDSLSTLNVHEKSPAADKFVGHVINQIKTEKRQGFFTCLQEDVNSSLVKHSCLYVDKVVQYNQPSLRRYGNRIITSVFLLFLGILPLLLLSFGSGSNSLTGFSVADSVVNASSTFKLLLVISSLGLLAAGVFFLHWVRGPNSVALKALPKARSTLKSPTSIWAYVH